VPPVQRTTIDALEHAMTFHRERHAVLAGNIANLDTPGYRPLDISRPAEATTATPAATDPDHIPIAESGQVTRTFDDGGAFQGPDGNAVQLERELAKIDANRARYSAASELVSRRLAMLRYAAGDGT
jgi:flagellar basal-body rod protein FlgB